MLRARAVVLAVALVLAPLGARAADLVVWWEQGFYAQEDAAVREIIAAFEQKTGKQVELVFNPRKVRCFKRRRRRSQAGQPPDFLFGTPCRCGSPRGLTRTGWSTSPGALAPVLDLFDADTIEVSTLLDGKTADAASTRCRWAGIPTTSMSGTASWSGPASPSPTSRSEWEAFWSFWCDQVQPAVRKATGPRRHLGRRAAHVRGGSATPTTSSFSSSSPTARPGSTATAGLRSMIPR